MRKRRKGKQVLDLSLWCEGTFFYEAASRFSTCREKNKTLKVQFIIGKKIITSLGTPTLTTSKLSADLHCLSCK